MKPALCFAFCILHFAFCAAQQHSGRVYDRASNEPLAKVLVTNLRSGAMWLSDSAGNVAFTAFPGDVVKFSQPKYRDAQARITGYDEPVSIALERAPIQLKGVEVLSPYAKYQRDSAFNREFFRKELGYARSQIGMTGLGAGAGGFGVGVGGVVSELALIMSGKRKEAKEFQKHMLLLEGWQFEAIRYTPGVVAAQTGLNDTLAEQFIARNPIPADFLRMASELELKQHIRDLYRAERRRDSLKAAGR